MDGFKNTTKMSYDTAGGQKFTRGGMTVSRADMPTGEGPMNAPAMVARFAKGGHVKKGESKIGRVMQEFTEGKLHSGSKEGPKVKSTKQAVAIALNEARAAGDKVPMAKAKGGKMRKGYDQGGSVEADDALMARMTPKEMAMGAKGIRMAKDRLARTEGPEPRARMVREVTEIVKPAKAVPAAKREPMFGPARSLTIPLAKGGMACGYKKGGLSVMPKGKC